MTRAILGFLILMMIVVAGKAQGPIAPLPSQNAGEDRKSVV